MLEKNSVSLVSCAETTLIQIDIQQIAIAYNCLSQPFRRRMNLPLAESLTLNLSVEPRHRPIQGKQGEPRHHRLLSFISNTCIVRENKQKQNCAAFPQTVSSSGCNNRVLCPHLTRNKKLIACYKMQRRDSENGSSDGPTVPLGFDRLLKARSTVIKQNKLQQFYISLGERQDTQIGDLEGERFKSNLFKSNLPKRRTKTKRSSLFLDKPIKSNESVEILQDNTKMHRKYATYEANRVMTFIDNDCTLLPHDNNGQVINKMSLKSQGKAHHLIKERKARKRKEKQNMEFNLQPWGNGQMDDPYF